MAKLKKLSNTAEQQEETTDILESYKELNEKLDIILDRIDKRTKRSKNKK